VGPFTAGELNKLVDALLHPLIKRDPYFMILDGVLHSLAEHNPPKSVMQTETTIADGYQSIVTIELLKYARPCAEPKNRVLLL
jgi:hypothetical protein